jgi:uncharacterized protein (DUF433 family)
VESEESMSTYVRKRDGVYRITGTRVALDSVIHAFLDGQSAESIAQSFPALTLEQVYGAIAYYLAQRDTVDAYLKLRQAEFEKKRQQARQRDPMFYQKLADARAHMTAPVR